MPTEDDDSELHRSNRVKTLAFPSGDDKGKEKMPSPPPEEPPTCGICLSDGGLAARGRIDSCEHFFCFVCIMEWARVESRCPLCKLRFHSILRNPIPGLSPSPRLVHVPHRDQVYHPLGNEFRGSSDPYEHVSCTECHSSNDEELLLLCDLCDSAIHTYCAGHGTTVPEGDWYCSDCAIARDQHSEVLLASDGSDLIMDSGVVQTVNPSIDEIVADGNTASSSQRFSKHPIPAESNDRAHSENVGSRREAALSAQTQQSENKARTLHRCRNVQHRITVLRENWNALRAGSLNFSSSLLDNGIIIFGKKNASGVVISDVTRKRKSSLSGNSEQMAMDGASGEGKACSEKSSLDVSKAWKMMKMAKALHKVKKSDVSNDPAKMNLLKLSQNLCTGSIASEKKILAHKVPGNTKPEYQRHFYDGEKNKAKFLKTEKCINSRIFVGQQNASLSGLLKPYNQMVSSLKYHGDNPSPDKGLQRMPWSFHREGTPACTSSPLSSVSGDCSRGCSKRTPDGSSHMKEEPKCVRMDANPNRSTLKRTELVNSSAKCEIQSLVKLNLKLLSKHLQLGTDNFRQIARVATHYVLAWCGLERPNSRHHSFPRPSCLHSEQIKQVHRSNLMPDSCRECFFSFVKQVVNSVMHEKIQFHRSHST